MNNPALRAYIETRILPQYDAFTDGHDRSHVELVLRECTRLAQKHNANAEMCYAMAAYHDLAIPQGRKEHHLNSAKLFMADEALKQWFTDDQRVTLRDAIEDHRASADCPPRTLYGCILADADHFVVPEDVVRRTVQYGLAHYPRLSPAAHILRAKEHLQEKYCAGGYLTFHLNDPRSLQGLQSLRDLAQDDEKLTELCKKYL